MIGRNKLSIFNYLVSVIPFSLRKQKNFLGLLLCSSVPLLCSSPSVASFTVEQQIAQVITAGTINRPTLKIGSQGEAVSELQAALKIMGYYNGAVDGTYGQTTATAVSQFKESAGLAPDGVVDAATWQQLFPGGQTVAASSDETSSAPPPRNSFPRPNNQTAANLPRPVVVSNQQSTITTTTTTSTNNGQEETVRTSSSVRTTNNNSRSNTSRQTTRTTNVNNNNNRQRSAAANTPSTTTNRRNANSASTTNRRRTEKASTTSPRSSATSNRSERSTSTYRTRQTDPNSQKAGIQYTAAGFPILRLGMRGEEVYDLQTRLKRLGYLNNEPDGDFGADTQAAVKALQRRFGMEEDGVAGGETWEILTRRRTNRSQS